MYTITARHDERDVYAKTLTIDAAIVAVKEQSILKGRAVVRDGGRIRIVATNGRATWVRECERCKGKGCVDGKYCSCVDRSVGRGLMEDLLV